MADGFILSEEDRDLLAWVLDDARKRRQNSARFEQAEPDPTAPEVYIAKTVSSVPAFTSPDTPGKVLDAKFYQLRHSGATKKLVQVATTPRELFNLNSAAVPADTWTPIARDKFGSWWALPLPVATPAYDPIYGVVTAIDGITGLYTVRRRSRSGTSGTWGDYSPTTDYTDCISLGTPDNSDWNLVSPATPVTNPWLPIGTRVEVDPPFAISFGPTVTRRNIRPIDPASHDTPGYVSTGDQTWKGKKYLRDGALAVIGADYTGGWNKWLADGQIVCNGLIITNAGSAGGAPFAMYDAVNGDTYIGGYTIAAGSTNAAWSAAAGATAPTNQLGIGFDSNTATGQWHVKGDFVGLWLIPPLVGIEQGYSVSWGRFAYYDGATLFKGNDLGDTFQGGLFVTNALADPGADRLVFWDDSAGGLRHLSIDNSLSITGTTLSAVGATLPTVDGTYTLQCTVSGGVATIAWV